MFQTILVFGSPFWAMAGIIILFSTISFLFSLKNKEERKESQHFFITSIVATLIAVVVVFIVLSVIFVGVVAAM